MNIKQQRAAALKAAQDIVTAAQKAGRELTPGEESTLQAKTAEIKSLDVKIKAAAEGDAIMARLSGIGPMDVDDSDLGPGELFTDSQKAGFVRAARTKSSFGATVRFKAPVLGLGLLPTSGVTVVDAPPATSVVALRDLFTQAEAEGPTVRYYKISAGTASIVAEGAVKPDAGMVGTAVDAALLKIASTFKVSDELAEDANFLVQALQTGAMRAVLVAENTEIATRLGATSGILTVTGTAATALDVIATAIGGQEAANGLTPSALVVNPVDLANMRKLKASTGGSYFIDPLAAGPSTVHGVRVVSTVNTPAGTAYLVGAGVGIFYTRGGLRIDVGYNADDWQRNLQTVRVEERVLPAITRPELITKVTLT